MAVTNYYTVDGEIQAEETGGNVTEYLSDALGSVISTVDQSAQVVNTYTYKPYGGQLAKTGTGPDPRFQWVGRWGYRSQARAFAEVYVRARHYDSRIGAWLSVDAYGPRALHPYAYVAGMVTSFYDTTGYKIEFPDDRCAAKFRHMSDCCSRIGKVPDCAAKGIAECLWRKNFGRITEEWVKSVVRWLKTACAEDAGVDSTVCILCLEHIRLPEKCDPCREGVGAVTVYPVDKIESPIPLPSEGETYGTCWAYGNPKDPCAPLHDPTKCACTVVMCVDYPTPESQCAILVHEMIHCGGLGGPESHQIMGASRTDDLIYALTCCFCEAIYGSGSSECRWPCSHWIHNSGGGVPGQVRKRRR